MVDQFAMAGREADLKKGFQIAGTFVGLVVGAGFASGQEIMRYFTSFGWYGVLGALFATVVFAFLGMQIAKLGFLLKAKSHKEVIYQMGGPYVGLIIDIFITFLLFGVAVVMFAGAGSMFEQLFGVPPFIGSVLLASLTIFTLMLNVRSILNVISIVTPYFLLFVLIIALYAIYTTNLSVAEQHELGNKEPSVTSNYLFSAIIYVSYNIATGASMLAVMGGTAPNQKVARFGGFLGGIILGFLILLINIAMLTQMDVVNGKALPMLELASHIQPAVGLLMSIALLTMMYNTAVGMLYLFTVRLIPSEKSIFKVVVLVIGIIGFSASFVGFTNLVGKLYATMGYIGFVLIGAIIYSAFRTTKTIGR